MNWLEYANQNAVRNDPLSDELVSAMSFLPEMGIRMRVVSGGQENNTTMGTGSTRHNAGNAGDVEFIMSDGTVLDGSNPEHQPIIGQIVQQARSRGVEGWGWGTDYMGNTRFHLGFGAPAVWGAGGRSANVDPWFRDAYMGAGEALASSQVAEENLIDQLFGEGSSASYRGRAPRGEAPSDEPTMFETLADAAAMLELSGGRRRTPALSPYISRGRQNVGSNALSRMGIASLA